MQTISMITLSLMLAGSLAPAEPDGARIVGFRNDYTGVFPGDCAPVTRWNEVQTRQVPYKDAKGRQQTREEVVGEAPVNLVWKTPLNSYCNGGMIVAGGKLFQMVDRGGNAYSTRLVPDFLGAQLVCINPADGTILWKEDCHHLDQLPAGERDKVGEDIKRANAFFVTAYPKFLKFRNAAGPLLGGGHGQPDYTGDQRPEGYPATYAKAAEEFAAVWPGVPRTMEEFTGKYPKGEKIWTWNYSQLAFGKFMDAACKEEAQRRNGLPRYGYNWNAWYALGSFVGSAMPTPVSDGRRVFVCTGYNDAFCYDLDGKRLWSAWYGEQSASWGAYLTSPVLVGDILVMHGGKGQHKEVWYRGIDASSGKELWHTPYTGGASYHMITPVPLRLKTPEGEDLAVVWTGSGNVLRVADGKVVGTQLGCHGNGRHVGSQGDVIVLVNGSSDGGAGKAYRFEAGTVAMRLKAKSRDEVTAELLWHVAKGPERLVVQDGVVYGFVSRGALEARDLETGKVLAKLDKPAVVPNHLSAIAGGHLFGLDADGHCLVVKLGKDALDLVGVNRLAPKHAGDEWFNQGAQPFFSGNRIFIRSYTDVYCIGDKTQPMRLSQVHR